MFNYSGTTAQANLLSPVISEEVHFSTQLVQERHEAEYRHDAVKAGQVQGQVLSGNASLKSGKRDTDSTENFAWVSDSDDQPSALFGLSYLA